MRGLGYERDPESVQRLGDALWDFFVFFLNGDVSLESSGHSERVQRAVGASNVRMFLAFKGLVHLEDWAFFFSPPA